ncbi:hypothetical protein [Clostridium sp.]|uniref:hypothetical protein n=1 Tax=Clostridium sp. TaxID=1506 RepID=UPI003F3E580C
MKIKICSNCENCKYSFNLKRKYCAITNKDIVDDLICDKYREYISYDRVLM